jgi:signal transduction histidine kinase/ligand-binding sensor domain-containing protein
MLAIRAIVTLHATDPERALSQYIRDHWENTTGFPGGPVYAITQTVDGYLWIAVEKGLVRFDGLGFHLFQPTESAVGVDSVALQLSPASDGTLWARLRRADFVRYRARDGAFEHVGLDADKPGWFTTAMSPANDGSMLIVDQRFGILSSRGDRVDTVVRLETIGPAFVTSIAQTPDGDIWLGTRDMGLMRVRNGRADAVTDGLPDRKINCLVVSGRDQLWIGTDNGIARWDGRGVTRAGLPAALDRVRATAMLKDRDANIWIGMPDGLLRVNSRGEASLDRRSPGTGVTAMFEDRDGDLWIGTTRGLERWRDGAFTTYAEVQTVTSSDAGPIFVDSTGRVWFGPSSGGLYWLRDGQVRQVTRAGLNNDVIYSIGGSGNDLWIGRQRGGLTHLHIGAGGGDDPAAAEPVETFTQANGLPQNYVYAVQRDREGGVWAGTLSGGASRFKDGVFTTYTTSQGLASNTVASVLEAADGTMWFATPNGASARVAGGWRRYSTSEGLPSNDVNTVFEDAAHNIWLGTSAGLAVVRDGSVGGLRVPDVLRTSIVGIAEDATRWLWIASADRIVRVDREALLQGTLGVDGIREYSAADGLRGIEGVKRHRSLVADAHGRIWLSTNGGLAMVDPVRVAGRSGPALVHIEEVSADGSPVDLSADAGGGVTIGPRRQRITLSFTGLSLSVPERVRFRYRLDGFDRDWSAPVSTRQAVYTNLDPGPYRFRVIASNSDGTWNSAEASLPFTIAAAWWETISFRGAVLILGAAAAWAAYRMRVRQVARQLNVRFEERLAERTRIARDLHDTLLQSFHGVLFRFQAAADLLPDRAAEAKQQCESAIDHAAQAITEGRDAVQNLRSASLDAGDLAVAIRTLADELAAAQVVDAGASATIVDVAEEGTPRHLHPLLRDEVYRVVGEALRNAFHHARARRIEVQIRYDDRQLQIRVRDNGQGISAAIDGQRVGHFGLAGMRERAELIGGKLDVWSEVGMGTEVDLTIPALAAYVAPRVRGRSWWFARKSRTSA